MCDGVGETPESLSGSSVDPDALPTEIDSIVPGCANWGLI